jgi:hypothetical protein
MKALLAVLSLIFSTAHAYKAPSTFSLTCTTSVAGASLYAEDGRLHFHLENGGGFENFPIYSGTVTPSMLPLIERGAKELAIFDADVDISWPLDKCAVDYARPYLIKCDGQGQLETPETTDFIATSMSTSTDAVDSLDVKAQVVNMNIGISTTGENFMHYFISMPFDGNHCSLKNQPDTATN